MCYCTPSIRTIQCSKPGCIPQHNNWAGPRPTLKEIKQDQLDEIIRELDGIVARIEGLWDHHALTRAQALIQAAQRDLRSVHPK